MKKLLLLLLFSTPALGQSYLFENIYGPYQTGCIQTAVTTSGANRSVALTIGKRFVLFGDDGSAAMNGSTIRCIQGGSTVDVTAIAGGLFGMTVFSTQQLVIKVTSVNNQFVSCISGVVTQKYYLCALP